MNKVQFYTENINWEGLQVEFWKLNSILNFAIIGHMILNRSLGPLVSLVSSVLKKDIIQIILKVFFGF